MSDVEEHKGVMEVDDSVSVLQEVSEDIALADNATEDLLQPTLNPAKDTKVPTKEAKHSSSNAVLTRPRIIPNVFTCAKCGEMYQGLHFFKKHMKEEHEDDIESSESTRNEEDVKEPPKPTTFKPYFIIHAGKGKSPPPDYQEYCCTKCTFIASTSAALDEHMGEKHKPKPRIPCDACGKDFARKWELQVHVKTVHLGIKDHQCPQCNYCSADKGRVQKHLKMVHWKVKEYQCDQCTYAGASTSSLKNHIKAIHLKLKEFKCDYCDHTAVQKGQINSHMKAVHLNIKPFACAECTFRAGDNATLKKHIRTKHEKIRDHLCPHCGYGSSNSKQLTAHIEKRHLHPKRRKLKPIPIVGMKLKTDWVPQKPKRPRR